MDQDLSVSNITRPWSIDRLFRHHRQEPQLPENFERPTQKQKYCPRDLLTRPEFKWKSKPGLLTHEFGYVFCHRGLYERASRKLDNSASAIKNGIDNDFFLHEVDAFIWERLDRAFVAHDLVARRITKKTGPWTSYNLRDILQSSLVARGVEGISGGIAQTNLRDIDVGSTYSYSDVGGSDVGSTYALRKVGGPNFGSAYIEMPEKVLGLLATLLNESEQPTGRTLQIDLRDEDFAKAIPFLSFHMFKRTQQAPTSRGVYKTMAFKVMQSTMLKGYNMDFDSFEDLCKDIQKNSRVVYKKNFFDTSHLRWFPPLIMVFYSDPLIKLADKTEPADSKWGQRSYEHLYHTFMAQVKSFIGVGPDKYNFILEIVHSGLGLGYDVKTRKATNPLNGAPLRSKDVIFDSLVDRVMIDVNLELKKKYPYILFSSCTRLPDVTTAAEKFKANFRTSDLVSVTDETRSEKGIATKLRTIHGGLYPQSNLVVADNPAGEIAARTWIDEYWRLDRRKLLTTPGRPGVPYYQWLETAGMDGVRFIRDINDNFLPNRIGDSVDQITTWDSKVNIPGLGGPLDLRTKIMGWLQDDDLPTDVPDQVQEMDHHHADNIIGQAPGWDIQHPEDDNDFKPISVRVLRKIVTFLSAAEINRTSLNRHAYEHALNNNEAALRESCSRGADFNTMSFGFWGTPLGAACAKGHVRIVEFLLGAGAEISEKNWVHSDDAAPGEPSQFAIAARFGHSDIVVMLYDALVTRNTNAHVMAKELGTALQHASLNGRDHIVKLLLDMNADVNFQRQPYHTPLQAACFYKGDIGTIETLIQAGADINAGGGKYGSALGAACASGHFEVVQLLLTKEAQFNVSYNQEHYQSPMYWANIGGNARIFKLLLDPGATISFTPSSLWSKYPEIVAKLRQAGIKIESPIRVNQIQAAPPQARRAPLFSSSALARFVTPPARKAKKSIFDKPLSNRKIPSTRPTTYLGEDLDAGHFEDLRDLDYSGGVMLATAVRLTRINVYGVEWIYDVETCLLTAWQPFDSPTESDNYLDVPAQPPCQVLKPVIDKYQRLDYIARLDDYVDFSYPLFSESGGRPPKDWGPEDARVWRAQYAVWQAVRGIKDIYVNCGWDIDRPVKEQNMFDRDEFLRKRADYWRDVVEPLIEEEAEVGRQRGGGS